MKLKEILSPSFNSIRRQPAAPRPLWASSLHARLLPPQAVKYICEDYCIDLPPELQNQQVLQNSPIYRNLIRELQMTTYFNGEWTRITEIPHDF